MNNLIRLVVVAIFVMLLMNFIIVVIQFCQPELLKSAYNMAFDIEMIQCFTQSRPQLTTLIRF